MTTLTAQEIAEVVREVTGIPYVATGLNTVSCPSYAYDDHRKYWFPNFAGDIGSRSQALAVVEWLCRKVSQMVAASATDKSLIPKIGELAAHICMYTDAKDTTALMRMVLELKRGR